RTRRWPSRVRPCAVSSQLGCRCAQRSSSIGRDTNSRLRSPASASSERGPWPYFHSLPLSAGGATCASRSDAIKGLGQAGPGGRLILRTAQLERFRDTALLQTKEIFKLNRSSRAACPTSTSRAHSCNRAPPSLRRRDERRTRTKTVLR